MADDIELWKGGPKVTLAGVLTQNPYAGIMVNLGQHGDVQLFAEETSDKLAGAGETALTMASVPVGMLKGGVNAMVGLADKTRGTDYLANAAADIERGEEQMIYQPKTEAGQSSLETIGKGANALGEKLLPAREAYEDFMNPLIGEKAAGALYAAGETALFMAPGAFIRAPLRAAERAGEIAGRFANNLQRTGRTASQAADVAPKRLGYTELADTNFPVVQTNKLAEAAPQMRGGPRLPARTGTDTLSIEELDKLVDPNVPIAKLEQQEVKYLDNLERQVKENGITSPITIRTRNGKPILIDNGMHRVAVMHRLGLKEAPVRYVDEVQANTEILATDEFLAKGLTPEQAEVAAKGIKEDQLAKIGEPVGDWKSRRITARTVTDPLDFQISSQRELVKQMRSSLEERRTAGHATKTVEKNLAVEERRLAKMESRQPGIEPSAPVPARTGQTPSNKLADVKPKQRGSLGDPKATPEVKTALARTSATVALPPRPKAIGGMFDNVTDYDQALSMAQAGHHLKQDKSGHFIGAPAHINSMAALEKQRRKIDKLVDDGEFNMDWYLRARQATREIAPGDRTKQSQFARGASVYSPQAEPPLEVGAFIDQHNAMVLTGQNRQPNTLAQMNRVAPSYADYPNKLQPAKIPLNEKTGPYADAKNPTIPDKSLYRTANDIWHGRAMGYGEEFAKGLTRTEHAYLTGENLLLAVRAKARDAARGTTRPAEWTPRSGQAATWGSKRKQKYIKDHVDSAKKKGKEITPELMAEIEKKAEAYAMGGIDQAIDRHSAYITSEARPGAGVNHLTIKGEQMEDPAMIRQYTGDVRKASRRDEIMDDLGVYSKNALPTEGYYKNSLGDVERNPGFVNQVVVSSTKGSSATDTRLPRQTSAADQAALDYSTQVNALLQAQEAGANSRFKPWNFGKQNVSDMNSVLIEHGKLTAKTRKALEKIADDTGVSLVNYGDETLLIKFGDEGPIAGTTREIEKAIKQHGLEVWETTRGTTEASYLPTGLTGESPGWIRHLLGRTATNALLKRGKESEALIPNLEARTAGAVSRKAEAMNAIDEAFAKATGAEQRKDLVKLRSILSKGGIPALRKYIKKNGRRGLPAVLLGLLGLQELSETSTEEGA